MYVHFVGRGPARCAAAWIPPGKQWWEIIPPSAFLPLAGAEVYEAEQYGQRLCADFVLDSQRYCEAGGARMVSVRLRSRSSAVNDLIRQYEWDFGDGQTAVGPRPSHVFLEPAVYTVTLEIVSRGGRRDRSAKRVRVEPVWDDLNFSLGKMRQFFDAVRAYRLDRLPTSGLWAAWQFARHMEEDEVADSAARLLDGRREELAPERLHELAMYMGDYHRHRQRDYELAQQYFELARDSVPEADRARRREARFALWDLYFYALDDPERAREGYAAILEDFPRDDPGERRRVRIRIGDTYRRQGKLQEALKAYREAETDPAYTPEKPAVLVREALFFEVQSYLLRGEGEEALKRLDELLWYYPTLRLEGRPALMRVRAALLQGKFQEAKEHAELYLGVGDDPNYLPAAHVRAAEACVELGLPEEAAAHYEAVLDKFPESPQVQDAENGLLNLGM
jgi:tetratricopeptide (TPR) repeat protein